MSTKLDLWSKAGMIISLLKTRRGGQHRAVLAFMAALALGSPQLASAQAVNPLTRADPVTIWDLSGNPAAQALSGDLASIAIREYLDLDKLDTQVGEPMENLDLSLGLGGLRYEYLHQSASRTHNLAYGLGLRSFGAGFSLSWARDSKMSGPDTSYNFGILYRPSNSLSLGITMEDAFSTTPAWGAGLALRPLAAWPRLESSLTLSSDMLIRDDSFQIQNVAVRLMLDSWLGLKTWINPGTLQVGLLAHVRLGNAEAELMIPDSGAANQASLAAALRLDLPGHRTSLPSRKFLLVLDDLGPIASAPPLLSLPGLQDGPWLGLLTEAIDRAATDPRVTGIIIYNPPTPDSIADGQSLYRSLSRFKASGKPVFVYARNLDRIDYIYAAAIADYLALDPNGQLGLTDMGSFDLYFRGLFDKLGIKLFSLQSHDTKTAFNTFTEYSITEAERTMKARYISGLASQMYDTVQQARGRRLSATAAEVISAGPYLIPSLAKKSGLVDGVMYRDEFEELVTKRTNKVIKLDIKDFIANAPNSWGPPIGSRIVPVLHLHGNIIADEGIAGRSIGESSAHLIAALREDSSVGGIILRVDSGGGSAFISDLIAREVELTVKAGKPVFVSMGGYAASGGYYLAAPATRIYAEAGSLTGSIGVTGIWPDATGLLEKLGIGSASVAASDSADYGNILLPRREADSEAMAASIKHIYERFIAVVARGRSIDLQRVDELGRGQVWLGSEAVGLGLVDEIGGLDAAKAGMSTEFGGRVRFVDLLPGARPVSMLGDLLGSVSNLAMGLSRRSASANSPSGSSLSGSAPSGSLQTHQAIPVAIRQVLDLAAELEELGSGPQTLFTDYLFRNRADR